MDINSIKAAIDATASVDDIITILNLANDNNVVLGTDYLKNLLNRQSVQVEGKTGITLFYSGGLQTDSNGGTVPLSAKGTQAWQIAESIGENNSKVLTIGQTNAYKLLNSSAFKDNIRLSDPINFNSIINGITENGVRIVPGMWDNISQRTADSAVDQVRTVTPFSLSDKVFAQTELPALLANSKVNSIDGIAKVDLLRFINDKGGIGNPAAMEAARSAIAAQSWLKALDLKIGVDSITGKLLVGDRDFFNINSNVDGSDLPSNVINEVSVSELMDSIHESQWDSLRQGSEYLNRIDTLSALEQGVDKLGKLGTAADVLTLVLASHDAYAAYEAGDSTGAATIMAEWSAKFAAGFAGGAELAGLAAAFSAPFALTGPVGAGAATIFTVAAGITGALLGEAAAEFAIDMGRKFDLLVNEVFSLMENLSNNGYEQNDVIASLFASATQAIQPIRRDPLVFDLDGDGLETTGIGVKKPIYFDHDADGIKTATGWVKSDDAFLVLDKNANGIIDNGRELFGDATLKSNGQLATDGFNALRDLDSNGDGKINSSDAKFASLRLWRDLNQDGISQSKELFTLDSQNIAAINLVSSSRSQILSNGNQLADLGSYIKSDGSKGVLGEVVGSIGDINLIQDTFHSQFTSHLDTSDVSHLPDMQGSGQVRNLQEAATLSPRLAQLLGDFAAANNRGAQKAMLNDIVKAWSDTSTMATTFSGAYAGHKLTVNGLPASGNPERRAWESKITLLEHFNGRTFQPIPAGTTPATLNFWSGNLGLLNQSYAALTESIYQSLILQTRLKPFLDTIKIKLEHDGEMQLDFEAMMTRLTEDKKINAANAYTNLLEIQKYLGNSLNPKGWDGISMIANWTSELQSKLAVTQLLKEVGYNISTTGNDIFIGLNSSEKIYGGGGHDVLLGNTGNDALNGDAGDDTLNGGIGDDALNGGTGSDTYLFGRGSGIDMINNYDVSSDKLDKIQFGTGILRTDIMISRSGDNLILGINGTTDKLTVANYFVNDATGYFKVEQIWFADGSIWSVASVKNKALQGTLAADTLIGYTTADKLDGLESNDLLYGRAGNDKLNGGPENDTLYGEEGDDTLDGGIGIDKLFGGNGNDVLVGGDGDDNLYGDTGNDKLNGGFGNDTLSGGAGSDIYLYSRGFGTDSINNYDTSAGKTDVLEFAAGIAPSDILLSRSSNSLMLTIAGTTDKVTISNYLHNDGVTSSQLEHIKFANGTVWKLVDVKAKLLQGTANNETLTGYATDDSINGGAGNDSLYGRAGNDTLKGDDGNDSLNGEIGNDSLLGGAGNDTLSGSSGNDLLDGGSGNDSLNGGTESDTYRFGRGSGQDSINNYDTSAGKTDVLEFAAGIAPSDILLSRSGDSLVLTIAGTTDKVTISNYLHNDGVTSFQLEHIKFANGTVWKLVDVKAMLLLGSATPETLTGYATDDSINGGAGNDSLYGRAGNDTLKGDDGNDSLNGEIGNDSLLGGAGNDTLSGSSGNDLLDGGTGNDSLNGGTESDTYRFGRGSGQDTINNYDTSIGKTDVLEFAAGIAPSDILLSRSGDSLVLTIAGTTDKITLSSYLQNDGVTSYQLEHIKFANGTVWKLVDVKSKLLHGTANNETLTGYATDDSINGGAGNDNLYGRSGNDLLYGEDGNDILYGEGGNDILDGGSGNDSLYGGNESDTYRFGRGSGQDTINNYDTSVDNTDVLEFAADIAPSDILLSRSGDSLVLTIAGTTDKVTISSYLQNDGINSYQLELITFANGTVWNLMIVKAMLLQGSANADTLTAYASDDIVNGNAGNDILYGRAGNDTLYGDDGNDTLYGEFGNDSLLGGEGNDSLNGSSGNDILDGENGIDNLYGGEGDDYLMGGIDKDTYTLTETTASTDTLRIRAGDSLMGGFDIVNGFKLGNGSGTTLGIDKLDLDYDLIAGNIKSANGIDSGIIRSHSIVNGKISFDDNDDYAIALTLTTSNLSNVFSYLQNNITTLGSTVAFTASGSTYVFQDNGINDTLVQLAGITAGSISTLGLVADGVWIG